MLRQGGEAAAAPSKPLHWGGGLGEDSGHAEEPPAVAVLDNELFDEVSTQVGRGMRPLRGL